MLFNVYIVRAFCRNRFGGNLAGVVVVEHPFTTDQMQALAKELNFSETIFISKTGDHSYKSLYFTPNSSIDFCGHATLAAFGVLKQHDAAQDGVYKLEAPVGLCEVSLKDSLIFLSQPLPVFGETIPEAEIAPVLGLSATDIQGTHLKPQVVSTGLRDIMVPVISRDRLLTLHPNHDLISKLSKKYDAVGMHVFALDSHEETSTAHCRNFAPLYGIPEESATGSSNGALACYLFQQKKLPPALENRWLFKQGDILNSPSDIYIRLAMKGTKIEKVECGGEIVVDEIKKIKLP
ncbi:MAG: PhzF family phenazine biosynthesis protein [Verrucomicrobia bacterium]|nr:PhzF family phenazine biosynthesis protein [Verrucomicrobiota bacterium]